MLFMVIEPSKDRDPIPGKEIPEVVAPFLDSK
jgi:hypothetical protein